MSTGQLKHSIRLANGKLLVLEIKGEDSDQNRAKRMALGRQLTRPVWGLVKGEQFKVMDVSIYHACSTRHIIICQAKAMPADELMELLTRHHRAVLIQIDGHFSCPTGLIIDFGNINSGLLHRFLIRPPCLMHKIERAT